MSNTSITHADAALQSSGVSRVNTEPIQNTKSNFSAKSQQWMKLIKRFSARCECGDENAVSSAVCDVKFEK